MSPESIVAQFGQYLASLPEAERSRALSRAKLLGMKEAPPEAFEPPIRTLRDYLAADIEVPPVLIHPTAVVRGGVNMLVGRAGKGKTVMSLNRSLRWAAGLPMFDGWRDADGNDYFAPTEPLKILIVENEGAAGMFHHQIGVMQSNSEFLPGDAREQALENIYIWGEGGYSNLKLDDPHKLDGLRAGVEKWEPDIMVIEPFRSLFSGEENSSTDVQAALDALMGIATDYNCGVIYAHHEKKSNDGVEEKMNAARGSTAGEGAITLMENFESVKAGEFRELSWAKVRYQDPERQFPAPVRMEWVQDAWWYRWIPMTDLDESILGALGANAGEPMSVKDLCTELDEKDHKLRPRLKLLEAEDRLKKLPSISGPGGSTGHRYMLPSTDNTVSGGVDF